MTRDKEESTSDRIQRTMARTGDNGYVTKNRGQRPGNIEQEA